MTIKAGWNVRFLNVYHGTTFEFEETEMANKYQFAKVEASAQYDFLHSSNADWYKTTEGSTTGKIKGTITEPNNNYTITYSNKLKPEFYIYHSSDNTVEKIAMTDERVKNGKFNIVAEVKEGDGNVPQYLYGGYYKAYGGQAKDDAGIIGLSYESNWATDTGGTR